MSKQPEALRLADEIEDACLVSGISRREHLDSRIDAAAELRRQHALIEQMAAALVDTTYFLERNSNRWDGINGKHPHEVVEAARDALAAHAKVAKP